MSANPSRSSQLSRPRTAVHGDGLADDEAIGDEFADGLTRVGVGDFVDFVGVKPNLAFAAAGDGSGETLLCAKVDPTFAG